MDLERCTECSDCGLNIGYDYVPLILKDGKLLCPTCLKKAEEK